MEAAAESYSRGLIARKTDYFFKAEQRSCLAAVVRIAALWLTLGRAVSSTNTGAYCRARRQISDEMRNNTQNFSLTFQTFVYMGTHLASHHFRLC